MKALEPMEPFATMLNDVGFEDYHVFRAKARMMTGFTGIGGNYEITVLVPFSTPTGVTLKTLLGGFRFQRLLSSALCRNSVPAAEEAVAMGKTEE